MRTLPSALPVALMPETPSNVRCSRLAPRVKVTLLSTEIDSGTGRLVHLVADVVDDVEVVARAAGHIVGTRTAGQRVVAVAAGERVVGRIAGDFVIQRIAGPGNRRLAREIKCSTFAPRVKATELCTTSMPAATSSTTLSPDIVYDIEVVVGAADKAVGARRAIKRVVAGGHLSAYWRRNCRRSDWRDRCRRRQLRPCPSGRDARASRPTQAHGALDAVDAAPGRLDHDIADGVDDVEIVAVATREQNRSRRCHSGCRRPRRRRACWQPCSRDLVRAAHCLEPSIARCSRQRQLLDVVAQRDRHHAQQNNRCRRRRPRSRRRGIVDDIGVISHPGPPSCQAPAMPFRMLFPALPISRLLPALPVPLMARRCRQAAGFRCWRPGV